ncbi:helix-turn-helix transcriptional regulator [Nocardia macrotermitis]|uniref:HTH deoR-type domain-containing protein n=1 Tax=Nocardia macrotermitis TaxID=2585198 RepID=A0A7K0D3V9_9NOCA|nr:YafY family protein [Nocardia macrotermitis]MQY20408.1 hypothetical protein [Nocardia macrotermitis]
MRAERLIAVLMLLQKRERLTAAAIAAELEVSERTILRDIEALSLSGVPVYAERGRNGGFALLPGYRTDLTGLTLDEAIALLSGTGRIDSPAAVSAMRKLEAALPEMHRDRVAEASQRILVRPEGFVRSPDTLDALAVLQQAVFGGRKVRIGYQRRGAEITERVLDPIGLIVAGGTWYLVANSVGRERMYRVSRVTDAELLEEAAERSERVDLNEVWERRRTEFLSSFEPLEVVIDCAPGDVAKIGHAITEPPVSEIDHAADTVRVHLRFADRAMALRTLWIASLEHAITIIEPDWVRTTMADNARRILARTAD